MFVKLHTKLDRQNRISGMGGSYNWQNDKLWKSQSNMTYGSAKYLIQLEFVVG